MNGKDIFLGLKYVGGDLIEEAEKARFPAQSDRRNARQNIPRPLLIAAIIALMLLLMGCAWAVMRLQHLTIREETSGIPTETSVNGERINVISIQGFMGTDSYAAFKEWQDFLSAYDPDHSILYANNNYQAPEAYFSYGCYSQEMTDKIDEICEKYHLQPLGAPWFFDRAEDVFDAVGIKSVFSENAGIENSSGYCYRDGTFNIEGMLELTGQRSEQVSFGFRSVQKTAFDGVSRNIGNVDAYDQWNYTMRDGTTVLLASREELGLIIVDKEDSFITVGVGVFANGSPFGNIPEERAFLEAVCEEFDFTYRTQPADSAKADALHQAQLEREATEDDLHVSGGRIDQTYLGSYAGWIDYMVDEMNDQDLEYALIDINGDGVEELLLRCEHEEGFDGNKNSFFALYTMEDGQIETIIRASNLYLCEGGVIDNGYTNSHYYNKIDGGLESVVYSKGKWYKSDNWLDENEPIVVTTEEEAKAIIAKYPRIDIDFRPVEDFPAE